MSEPNTDEGFGRESNVSTESPQRVRFENVGPLSPQSNFRDQSNGSAQSLDASCRKKTYLKNEHSSTSVDSRSKSTLGKTSSRLSEASGTSAVFDLARRRVRHALIHDDVSRMSAMQGEKFSVDKVLHGGGREHSFQQELDILYDRLDAQRSEDLSRNRLRRWADLLAGSNVFQFAMAVVIIGHICLGAHDTDLRASEKATPAWVVQGEAFILTTYMFEICLRCYVERLAFFLQAWNIFDCAIVICDVVMTATVSYGGVSLLRSIRLLRVLRVVVRFSMFREVYLMIQGVNSAIRTLVFGALIGFAIMTSWSLIAVEILNPLVKELADQGMWEDCERCPRAFSSVMAANLTFFKSVVAGDSWGQICVPLMERYTQAAVLLTLVFLTIQLGVVNIIIAVIVDQVHEARVRDESLRKTIKEEALHKSYRRLWRVFKSMDVDETGEISLEQMLDGYSKSSEFRFLMNSIDFTSENMDLFFDILDKDRSGGISYDEFVEQLHVMREFDSHSMLVIITHLVEKLYQHIDARLDDQKHLDRTMFQNLVKNVQQTKELQTLVRNSTAGNVRRSLANGISEGNVRQSFASDMPESNNNDSFSADQNGRSSAKTDMHLCNDLPAGDKHDDFSAYEDLLDHICMFDFHLHEVVCQLLAEGRQELLDIDDTAELSSNRDLKEGKGVCHESLIQEVLQRARAGLSEEGELEQIRRSVQTFLSYARTQAHNQAGTEQKRRI